MKITEILEQKGKTLFSVKVDSSAFTAVEIMDTNRVRYDNLLCQTGDILRKK